MAFRYLAIDFYNLRGVPTYLGRGVPTYLGGGLGARIGVGAVAGGVSSVMAGGDFAMGAMQGVWSTAIASVCNDWLHPRKDFKIDYEKGVIRFEGELVATRLADGSWVVGPMDFNPVLVPEIEHQEWSVAVDICDILADQIYHRRISPLLAVGSLASASGSVVASGGWSLLFWGAGAAMDLYSAYIATNLHDTVTNGINPIVSAASGSGGVALSSYNAIRTFTAENPGYDSVRVLVK